jgi:hypothetical protein
MKKTFQSEYKTTFEMIFRIDNFLRILGASLVYLAVSKRIPVSTITTDYFTAQSDVFFILVGVVSMIVLPDLRKYLITRFGGEK